MNFTMDLPGSSQETVFAGGPRKLLGNAVLVRSLYEPHTFLYCPYTAWNRLLIFYEHQCFSEEFKFDLSRARPDACVSF